MGTLLAFAMSVTALSLPEALLLRKVMKPKLLAAFFGTVSLGIIFVVITFNICWANPAYRATLLIKFLEINDLSKVLFDGDIQG